MSRKPGREQHLPVGRSVFRIAISHVNTNHQGQLAASTRQSRSRRLERTEGAGAQHARRYAGPSPGHSRAAGVAADSRRGARSLSRAPAPRGQRAGPGAWDLHGQHPAVCRGQCASRLHGLGAWRRHAGRDAGGNAGGRAQCQPGWPRPHPGRGGVAGAALGDRAVRLSRGCQRAVPDRLLHGQPVRRAGRPDPGARVRGTVNRHGAGCAALDGVHLHPGAWLHRPRHGPGRPRQGQSALDSR